MLFELNFSTRRYPVDECLGESHFKAVVPKIAGEQFNPNIVVNILYKLGAAST